MIFINFGGKMKLLSSIICLILFHTSVMAKMDPRACSGKNNTVNTVDGPQNISLLRYEDALALFNSLKNPNLKFPYLAAKNNCDNRAHWVSEKLFNDYNISSVKTFLKVVRKEIGQNVNGTPIYDDNETKITPYSEVQRLGNIDYGWGYHTAAAFCVLKNGKKELYVFDHAVFNTPVPYKEWEQKLTRNMRRETWDSYATNMYNLKELGESAPQRQTHFQLFDRRYVNSVLQSDWPIHIKSKSQQIPNTRNHTQDTTN